MRLAEILESAAESGTYVAAIFSEDTVRSLSELQKEIEVPNPIPSTDFHATIVCSRTPIEWKVVQHNVPAEVVGYRVFETGDEENRKNCLVLEINCPELTERFNEAKNMGATFDFPSYIPHITLSYDIGEFSTDGLAPPSFDLMVTREFEDEFR